MKKTRFAVLALSVAVLATPMFQSFAMVPVPESLRQTKEREKAKPDPDTTVIESGKMAIFPPTGPLVAIFPPTAPPVVA